jgi:D-alanyl-D-alanine dipeptidase
MNPAHALKTLHSDPDFVRLHGLPGILIDLKYASDDNFMSKNVYGEFNEAFLHRVAAEKLQKAVLNLKKERPEWKFLVLDALRPRSIQRVLWDHVAGTDQEDYVANPDKGSVHNYGLAVDLTCVNEAGEWVNMGSGFDFFHRISQPRFEEEFLKSGELKREHWENRLVLRRAMTSAGFLQLPHEWWHFDALPRDEIRNGFRLIE